MDIQLQISEVNAKYPELHHYYRNGISIIRGDLHFIAAYNSVSVEDIYTIKIEVPENYPDEMPRVYEESSIVEANYHTNDDGTLCLGTAMELRLKLIPNVTILSFIDQLLVPYFYRYTYIKRFGKEPWGERPHCLSGVFHFYREFFAINDDLKVVNLLRAICIRQYKGHHRCYCGSGQIFRKCHGSFLINLDNIGFKQMLIDFFEMYKKIKNDLGK